MGYTIKVRTKYRPKHSISVQWVRNKFRFNQNWICAIVGGTGTGKSYSAIALARAIDPTFDQSRIVFTPQEFVKLVTEGNLKEGSMIVYDEAGVGMDARQWFSIQNKALNYILQTFRRDNIGVIFTVPDITFIDKNARKLFHTLIETVKLDRVNDYALVKWFNISPARRYDKVYYVYNRYADPTGRVHSISLNKIKKPPAELIDEYETRKKQFVDELKKEMYQEIMDSKASKRMNTRLLKSLVKQLGGDEELPEITVKRRKRKAVE